MRHWVVCRNDIVLLAFCAVLCGCDIWVEIETIVMLRALQLKSGVLIALMSEARSSSLATMSNIA